MLSTLSILSVLLSLLLVQNAFAPPPPSVHHNHQERYENPRENSYPVWFNLSIDVWGYFDQSQAYYRTNHSITFDQKEGNITINDFQLRIHNLTYYGLNLNGEIVYNCTIMESIPQLVMSPPQDKVALTFDWGSENTESRIENMIFTQE
jgi:hypothetical protein